MTETEMIAISKTKSSRLPEVDFNNLVFGKQYSDHMFVADFDGENWTDLQIIPYQNLALSPATCALHYGQSIFEGLKAYKNAQGETLVFRPDQNFERFNRSATRMSMPEVPKEIFFEGLNQLLTLDKGWIPTNEGSSLYIRPFMFATDEFIGLKSSLKYKFIIFTCPVGAYYAQPVKVKIETEYTRAAKGGVGAAKTAGNYAASLYPTELVKKQGYDQIIWTDAKDHKYIEEAGSMNVMFLIGDTLITPQSSDTILAGITRRSVVDLVRSWGLKVEERQVSLEEVLTAIKNNTLKEAFGAGTAATISSIEVIAHDGIDYQLPNVADRKLEKRILAELDGMKRGTIEDTRNWIYKL